MEMGMGIDAYSFSFQGGGALPEDTSCEGCRGQITEIRQAVGRHLGRLGGDQKNPPKIRVSTLSATPKTYQIGFQYAICYLSLLFLGCPRKSLFLRRMSKSI